MLPAQDEMRLLCPPVCVEERRQRKHEGSPRVQYPVEVSGVVKVVLHEKQATPPGKYGRCPCDSRSGSKFCVWTFEPKRELTKLG